MALRTISATGGNFGSVSTWIEGVVPTSSDHVVGNSASGNLTMNAAYTVQYIDLSGYTGLYNMSSFALTLGLANATSSFGASISFTYSQTGYSSVNSGVYGGFFCNVAHNFSQTGTVQIPCLTFGTGTKTLATDLHCFRFRYTQNLTCNGNNLFVYEGIAGNSSGYNSSESGTLTLGGTTKYIHVGSGTPGQFNANWIHATITGTLEIRGFAWSSFTQLTLNTGSTLIVGPSASIDELFVFCNVIGGANQTFTFDTQRPIGYLGIGFIANTSAFSTTINCNNNPLMANVINVQAAQLFLTNPAGVYTTNPIRFFGQGVSASQFYATPRIFTGNWSSGFPSGSTQRFMKVCPVIRFDSNGTYSIPVMNYIGLTEPNLSTKFQLSSITASTDAKVITGTNSFLYYTDVTDIDASGGSTLYTYGSVSIASSTNVQLGPPSGGTGSVSYQFGFATMT